MKDIALECIVPIILLIVFIVINSSIKNRKQFINAAKFYIAAFVVSGFLFLSCLSLLSVMMPGNDNSSSNPVADIAIIALLTMIFSGIGTISTAILGWRNEIRNNTETKLKIEKLELEIKELKAKEAEKDKLIVVKK